MTGEVLRIRHPRIERFSITPSFPNRGEPGVRGVRNQTGKDTSTRSKFLRGVNRAVAKKFVKSFGAELTAERIDGESAQQSVRQTVSCRQPNLYRVTSRTGDGGVFTPHRIPTFEEFYRA